ncbi:MAG: hypothetical protein H8E55_61360 [Pelagibacterales bacterium]|jgi:hypothetical protein|nr:hypothetical protein [Pelagibacterales bacterium]
MKSIILTLILILLTNCSTHTVKLGKKCTKIAENNTYEKSLIWLVDKESLKSFNQKINKKNCEINGEKS